MIKLYNNDFLKIDFSDVPKFQLVITSPPYNVGIEYDTHKDNMTYGGYLRWTKRWIGKLYEHIDTQGRICINVPFTISPEHLNTNSDSGFINYPVAADFTKICEEVGFKYWRTVIWEKTESNSSTTWGSWRSASSPFMRDPSEAIIICYKDKWKRDQKGESTITGPEFMTYSKNVWRMKPEVGSKHPAAFPLELPNRCIKLLSFKDDWVLDPFTGSGTVGESSVRLNRNFIGSELSPDYFKMAEERIESAEFQTNLRKDFFPVNDESNESDW